MRRLHLVALLLAGVTLGCGAAAPSKLAAMAPQQQYQQEHVQQVQLDGATFGETLASGSLSGGGEPVFRKHGGQYTPRKGKALTEPDAQGMTAPQVVYLGYLNLRVRRLIDAIDDLTARVEKAGGYVESLSSSVMIARVPGDDFEAAMDKLAEVGDVLERRVKALDVTDQFLDIKGRLAVARETRDRLLALLEETKDTEERLKILQEIKRLTEQIESMASQLATLQDLVDYYTITIELQPMVADRQPVVNRSPFRWIRGLRAHVSTLDGTEDVDLPVPAGFVQLDDADGWMARAADTSVIRISQLDNEPRGDGAWWAEAITHEMEGRDEALDGEGAIGGLSWMMFREKDVRPRGWLIAVMTRGDDLFVIEAFLPDAEAVERHRAAVLDALKGFGPR